MDYEAIKAAKDAIITILSSNISLTAIVPANSIYNTDWAFRTANEFPGISVEQNRRLQGTFETGKKELIVEFKIRCYSEQIGVEDAIDQANHITNLATEILETHSNIMLNGTVTDSEVAGINYNYQRAGASVKSVSWATEITFNVQMYVNRL